MINRDNYLNKLIRFKDKELIKVVTGIRRCGKSTLFDLYINYLLQNGVKEEQIIRLNLEDPIFYELDDYLKLYNYIKDKMKKDKMNYIFIDEVQNVKEFQKAVDKTIKTQRKIIYFFLLLKYKHLHSKRISF